MADLGPRQPHNLRLSTKRLEQYKDTEKQTNHDGPDHRERTNHDDNGDGRQCQLEELVLGYASIFLPRLLARRFIQRVPHIYGYVFHLAFCHDLDGVLIKQGTGHVGDACKSVNFHHCAVAWGTEASLDVSISIRHGYLNRFGTGGSSS